MAFKDASGAFRLERSEEDQALSECVYGEGRPRLKRWGQFDPKEQAEITFEFLRKHPEKRPDPDDPPDPHNGLTKKQLGYLGGQIEDVLRELLPTLVEAPVAEALSRGLDLDSTDINRVAHQVTQQMPGARDLAEMKRENTAMKAEVTTLRAQLLALATKGGPPTAGPASSEASDTTSFERRLSRHAEHLAGLESRMKKLEHHG